ncbi:hypothetical protein WA026_009177 [Henosepilachna vigintioctopunctata]|uniref:Muscle M-line assembly protein unc-89 n=1 Tax=Henosepilachna vigintioctopunctata TaxID=420089 RepID=A0AAW1UYL2_9CUCU
MSSVLKPSLSASVSQNSSVPSQLSKPMHPQQGPPQSYGQPSNHHPVMSHGNPAAAHNQPTTHQSNHYSLNVPNASGHYLGNSQPIPASNHPIPNNPLQTSGQQMYGGAKNMAYQGGYQPNLGHPPNSAMQLPPVSQSLPATNAQLQQQHVDEVVERTQSNGTSEGKQHCAQENHVSTPKETSHTPALPMQTTPQEKTSDRPIEASKPADKENESIPTASEKACQKPSSPSQSDGPDLKASEHADNGSSSAAKEVSQPEGSGTVVQSEKKTEDFKCNEINDDAQVSDCSEGADKVDGEGSLEPESANTPADSEKASLETTKDVETKDKSTPKSRSASRKISSRSVKSDEESSKTPRSEPKVSPSQKSPSTSKSKRARIRTQPYQSPLPELEIISKISASTSQRNRANDDKLIVFFKNEFLAVRNSEGSFYICQAVQNIYKSSAKIRIRWLSQDKNDKSNEIYTPDFYDNTDFDCILTNLNLERVEKGKFRLPPAEHERTDSILKRSLAAEKGEEIPSPTVTEEHPDGLDLSLYKDENQLNKRKGKKRTATSPIKSSRSSSRTPAKKSPDTPKVAKETPKSTRKAVVKKDTPATLSKKPVVATPTPKKSGGSRTDRAKRRSENANIAKGSPVSPKVDQKKAKALAKVARKGAISQPKLQTPSKKETKASKPTPSPPVKAKTNVKTVAISTKKKTPKRSTRK